MRPQRCSSGRSHAFGCGLLVAAATALAMTVLPCAHAVAAPPPVSVLLTEGRINEAMAALAPRVRDRSSDAEAWNLSCRCQSASGNFAAAIALCENAVALAGDNAQYHLWLARAYAKAAPSASWLGAVSLALRARHEFERAVELDPRDAVARSDLAEYYIEAPAVVGGSLREAEAQADAVAAIDPARAHSLRGRIADARKDDAAARSEYEAAAREAPRNPTAWYELGDWLRRHGEEEGERRALEHLLDAGVVDTDGSRFDAAQMLVDTGGDAGLAEKILRKALEAPPLEDRPAFRLHVLLGSLLEHQGDRDGAVHEYRTALAMASEFGPAAQALARLGA